MIGPSQTAKVTTRDKQLIVALPYNWVNRFASATDPIRHSVAVLCAVSSASIRVPR